MHRDLDRFRAFFLKERIGILQIVSAPNVNGASICNAQVGSEHLLLESKNIPDSKCFQICWSKINQEDGSSPGGLRLDPAFLIEYLCFFV